MDNKSSSQASLLKKLSKIRYIPIKIIVLANNSNEIVRYFALFILFVLFASLPPYLLFSYHGKKHLEKQKKNDIVQFESVGISESRQSLLVENSEDLQAVANKDFMLYAWFKISKLPEVNQRIILLRKFYTKSKSAPGYAISIFKSPDGLRAAIYWNNAQTNSVWYNLSHFNIPPQEWFLLALTRLTSNSVGAHLVYKNFENKVIIDRLGGFKHDSLNLGTSLGNLEFGAQRKGIFSGKVGPFGVLRAQKLRKNIDQLLIDLYTNPLKNPSDYKFIETLIWSPNAKDDLGPNQYVIKLSRLRKKNREQVK